MRCQHGEKISLFCVHEGCPWRDAGGCQKCFKRYHDHLPTQFTLNNQQLESIFKKTVLKNEVKLKCRPLQEAIYNYFMIMKSQISSSLDAVSRAIINKISHPYLEQEGQLGTYKKIKSREYKKIGKKQLVSFYHFSKNLSLEQFERMQRALYYQETENILNEIRQVNESFMAYAKAASVFDTSFNHEHSFYEKIKQIGSSILQTKQQSTNEDEKKENFENILVPEIKTSQVERVESKKEKEQDGQLLKIPKTQVRSRRVSIDASLMPDKQKLTYNEKEKKIEQEKRKLLQLLDTDKKKKPTPIDISFSNSEKPKKKVAERFEPVKLDSVIPIKYFDKKEEKEEKHEKESQKSEDGHHEDTTNHGNESNHSESSGHDHGLNLFTDLLSKGINIPEMIVHTILPAAQQKKKLYENTEEVKEKRIVIPVRQYERIDEVSSPILKKRKKDKGFNMNLQLKRVQTIKSEEEKVEQKVEEQPQEQLELKEREANSLALLVESLPLQAEKAIPLLEAALKYSYNNLSAGEYLSYLYLQIGKAKQCLDLCNEMLQQMEDSAQYNDLSLHINNNKAAALNMLGRYSQSISILEKCLQYSKKDIFYKNLGDAYYSIGIYEKAIYNYENAVHLNDSLDEAYYNMSVCLFQQQNYYHAQLSIHQALKVAPQNPEYMMLNNEILKKITSR